MVVIGYGTQKKSDLTGSVSSVSSDEFKNEPISNVNQGLQGKVSGVQVTSNSGSPGGSETVKIRGSSTLDSSNPLYVVDRNPLANSSFIEPENIESIEVLKGVSAAAIYGSRAANGVLLITTKQGNSGKSQINFNMYRGFQQVSKKLDLTNASQWAKIYNQTLINSGGNPAVSDPEQLGEGTNWQDEIFTTAPIGKYSLALSGGNDKNTYRLSGSYLNQKGIVENTDYNKVNFHVNANHNIKPWLEVGENLNLTYNVRNSVEEYDRYENPIKDAIQADPTFPVRNENGDFTGSSYSSLANPVAQLNYANPNGHEQNLFGNVYAVLDLIKDLSIRSQFNVLLGNSDFKDYRPVYYISQDQQNTNSSLSKNLSKSIEWVWRNTATFEQSFGKHDINILGGIIAQVSHNSSLDASAIELSPLASTNPNLRYLDLASSGYLAGSRAGEFSIFSLLGRINYNYDNRYLLMATIRRDGSSKFGKNNRFGIFPSFSAGWNISNENFMRGFDAISQLKIRGSWGAVGNQTNLSNYAFVSPVSVNIPYPLGKPDSPALGKAPSSIGNNDLKWETVREWGIGVDLGILSNKINFTADYYNKKTSDLLVQIPIPDLVGVPNSPFTNGGDIVNRGFEFSIGYKKTISEFTYNISANLSTLHNEVTNLANKGASFSSGFVQNSPDVSRTAIGHPIASYYGYVTDGIFQTPQEIEKANNIDGDQATIYQGGAAPGDIRFKDLNGDGAITDGDRTYIGNHFPDIIYGVNADFHYKNVDLAFSLTGESGNDIFAGWKYYAADQPLAYNYYAPDMLNSWTGPGTSNTNPRLTAKDPNDNGRLSDRFVEDGSYIRLRNIQLGYSLPSDLVSKLNIMNIRIYMNAQNLFTITGYDGFTPEIGTNTNEGPLDVGIDLGTYPQPRIITAGLNFSF